MLPRIHQINPLYSHRPKRALFDGLGVVIKTITGNLDYKDGEKYDKIIEHLHVTILKGTVKNFDEHAERLAKNQLILKTKIDQLQSLVGKRNR